MDSTVNMPAHKFSELQEKLVKLLESEKDRKQIGKMNRFLGTCGTIRSNTFMSFWSLREEEKKLRAERVLEVIIM